MLPSIRFGYREIGEFLVANSFLRIVLVRFLEMLSGLKLVAILNSKTPFKIGCSAVWRILNSIRSWAWDELFLFWMCLCLVGEQSHGIAMGRVYKPFLLILFRFSWNAQSILYQHANQYHNISCFTSSFGMFRPFRPVLDFGFKKKKSIHSANMHFEFS